MALDWNNTNKIRLDWTMMFGQGYDFFGLENLRQEATGPNGNYLMWPNGGRWYLYRDSDGAYTPSGFSTREECELVAEGWCEDVSTRNG